jgi:hypothetical protein
MISSIRNKTSADSEQEQLKLKLEQYRCSNKPPKSILKPSGSGAAARTPASKSSLRTGSSENAHPVLPITPKFKATEMSTSKSRSRPTEPSAVAAESHLQAIMKRILTDVNSLANTNKIQEVMENVCSPPTFFSESVVGYFSRRPNHLFGPK